MKGLQPNFFGDAADIIAKIVPHAERQTIENEGHVADPKVLGKLLEQFFMGYR